MDAAPNPCPLVIARGRAGGFVVPGLVVCVAAVCREVVPWLGRGRLQHQAARLGGVVGGVVVVVVVIVAVVVWVLSSPLLLVVLVVLVALLSVSLVLLVPVLIVEGIIADPELFQAGLELLELLLQRLD